MALADMLPTLDDASLVNLKNNATRLAAEATGARHDQAADLLPLIEAELAERAAKKPPKVTRRAPRAPKAAKVAKVAKEGVD